MFYLDSEGGRGRGGDTYLVEVVISTAIRTVEPAKATVRVLVHATEGSDRDLMAAVEAGQFPTEEGRHGRSLCSAVFWGGAECLVLMKKSRDDVVVLIVFFFFLSSQLPCCATEKEKAKQRPSEAEKGNIREPAGPPAAAPFGGIFWTAERMNYSCHYHGLLLLLLLLLLPSPSSSRAGPRSASAGPAISSPSDHSPRPQRDGHAKCTHPLPLPLPLAVDGRTSQPDRKMLLRPSRDGPNHSGRLLTAMGPSRRAPDHGASLGERGIGCWEMLSDTWRVLIYSHILYMGGVQRASHQKRLAATCTRGQPYS